MKNGNVYSLLIGLIALLSACAAKIQTYNLNDEYAVSMHYKGTDAEQNSEEEETKSDLVGVPVKNFYGGDLKRGGIWWAGKDIFLEKGEVFIFDATNVGPDTIPFGATFPPIDLTKEEVKLKISAYAEGVNGTTPTLYFQVDDVDGYQANAKRPFAKIENSADSTFADYYFDMKDMYTQAYPKKHKVNGAMINTIKFFINPGQEGFTGKIYIKEIKVVSAGATGK